MKNSTFRLAGTAAALLLLQILFVNALTGARGNSASLTTTEVSAVASASSPPAEAFSQDNGRYDMFLNSKNSNYHFVIDTAEGRLWQARFKVDGTVDLGLGMNQNTYQVSNWRQVEISPPPPGRSSSPGRFRVFSDMEDVKETFLLDSLTGHVYLMFVIDEQQAVMFRRVPVDGLYGQ